MTDSFYSANLFGRDFTFHTDESSFSPTAPDKGTLAMLSVLSLKKGQKVLDLGCSYGLVGISVASIVGDDKVFMSDIHEASLSCARKNIERNHVSGIQIVKSDAFSEIEEKDFDLILSNPPYHADFSVPKAFLEKGFNRLCVGGSFFMVTKRKDWYKNKFISIFGGVRIHEIDGYYIFEGQKRTVSYRNKK